MQRTIGSFIEHKKSSITWHYRAADPEFGSFQCKQCHDLLEGTIASKKPIEGEFLWAFPMTHRCRADHPLSSVLVGKKNLEVRPLAINKGEIVKRIMYDHPDAEFVFCAGDDKVRAISPSFFSSLPN